MNKITSRSEQPNSPFRNLVNFLKLVEIINCNGLVQSVTNIFEYSNVFDPNIYSGICSYHFLDMNIFGYSFVSTFWIRIYSDIRLWQDFDSNIFEYSFVSIFRTPTDSEDVFIDFLWILYFAYGYFVDINDQKCYLDCKNTELVPVVSRV